MPLNTLNIETLYFLGSRPPIEFYSKIYKEARQITMGLGYFSGKAFSLYPFDIVDFIKREGYLRIICNDKLFRPDIDAIVGGYSDRKLSSLTGDEIDKLMISTDDYEEFGYRCLRYMIANRRADIKIISAKNGGLVHFKIGYASDDSNAIIAFDGSVNYTVSGMLFNKEQLHTTKSWKNSDDFTYCESVKKLLDDIWYGKVDEIVEINPDKIIKSLSKSYELIQLSELEEENKLLKQHYSNIFSIQEIGFFDISGKKPRDYQIEAAANWRTNSYQTLLAMATGTGKTFTSLYAINQLVKEKPNIDTVLILVPLKDLVAQWIAESSSSFEGTIVSISSDNLSWEGELSDARILQKTGKQKLLIVCTYRSFQINNEKIVPKLNYNNTVLVADEVHRFGSKGLRIHMPQDLKFRLGLSATPLREHDEQGTNEILKYFAPNGPAYEFNIGQAIARDLLCPYYYYPIFIDLDDDEIEEYKILSNKISKVSSYKNSDDNALTLLLKKRHRIIEHANGKYESLTAVLDERVRQGKKIDHAIFYLPEGNDDEDSHINNYRKLLFKRFHLRIAEYVQNTSSTVLDAFKSGSIEALAALKRLDEGIDIPEINQAYFIASSTSSREFIQRRGRVLRRSPGKVSSEIYDFLVRIPNSTISIKSIANNQNSEIRRALDFADTAINRHESLSIIENG